MMLETLSNTRLAELSRGWHACMVYSEAREAIEAVAPYLGAGLERKERCLYVLGEHELGHVTSSLAAAGVDVQQQQEAGALAFVDRWEVSFPDGNFDPAAMVDYVRAAIADAVAAGFSGLRVAAEMSWALGMGVGHNKLIHYSRRRGRRALPGRAAPSAVRAHGAAGRPDAR